VLAKSWLLSRCHYRWHGHALDGRTSELVWYLAHGSNMHHSAFRERRRMRPVEWRVGRVQGYRLRFNLEGRPPRRGRGNGAALRAKLRQGDNSLVGNSAYRRYLKTPDQQHFTIDEARVAEDGPPG
jgi:hypothetical protein